MSAITLRAGARPFWLTGHRVEPGAVFAVELAIAVDSIDSGRASPLNADGSAAIATQRKAEREALLRMMEGESRRALYRVA